VFSLRARKQSYALHDKDDSGAMICASIVKSLYRLISPRDMLSLCHRLPLLPKTWVAIGIRSGKRDEKRLKGANKLLFTHQSSITSQLILKMSTQNQICLVSRTLSSNSVRLLHYFTNWARTTWFRNRPNSSMVPKFPLELFTFTWKFKGLEVNLPMFT